MKRNRIAATTLRSLGDGVWIGAVAGAVYALLVGAASLLGFGNSALNALELAAIVAALAVPTGVVSGAVLGVVFGLVAAVRGRASTWHEPVFVALIGVFLIVAVVASVGVTGGALAWSAAPLVVGTPAAWWHTRRLRRRIGR